MNRLIAEVFEIQSLERVNLIKFKLNEQIINVLILEMNLNLKVGKKAELLIKPTAVSVLKNRCVFENVLSAELKDVEKGKILSRITVDVEGFAVESIMIKELADFEGSEVYIAFKANEVAISKVFE